MSNILLRAVTAEEKALFKQDGVVCLRQIIAPEWVDAARDGIEELRTAPGPYASIVDKGELLLYVDQMPSVFNEKLRRVALESGTAAIARALHDDVEMRWVFDQIFYKGKGIVAETPWHQDTPYGCFDGMGLIRVWMPVDHVPRETTIEVVRGSHLWNVEYGTTEATVFEENKDHTKNSGFDYTARATEVNPPVPNIEASRGSFDIIGHAVEPGDVVVFNYHVLHHAAAGENRADARRAFAVIYGDDKVSFRKRPNMVPSVLEHFGKAWKEGQRFSDFPDIFPVA
ncbi:phytanoyl-CoA dioxygenase family protein [Pseudokordiimonas caeni]|uniref:phytanoyl-CoA dioxygenase family protein n=1 Tax=Pseudokordiimonas caeni TaxID=2997908 RepID=UPI0028121030|nr:phytanoyl-CoA dioxygenase family protein [Pseudokordiimonas caeni]